MKKQSWMIAAALLALSLTGCSAPTESTSPAAEPPDEPARIVQTVESESVEKTEVHENVPLSFSVGDEAEEKITGTEETAADTTPETLPPDAESDTTAPTQQAPAEEQSHPSAAANPAQPAAPAESQPPAEPSADPAPVSGQQPTPEQLPEPTPQPQPEPAPAPAPAPQPTPAPEPAPTPQPEPAPQPVDINAIVQQAQAYGLSIGLEWDATATDCWDNPITATPQSLYVSRDLCGRLDWYKSSGFEAFCVWSEATGDGNYLVYVGYA